ncbi:kinase-like domain-containing protein [Rhizophagus irregularis DAOM 181602=DAOM 197198]|uniref:Uncharacterized protein n=1 Tax=Rhizophagus irregularis (strain DAOM 181602 / DAOM 197198 / MUCL 43194) TaxID=747089 RepID=A0A2P4Q3X7_RHIID|nr:hypothetical protein GLOIN_2v1160608 [Rhizophagus irregularis DAOM 181602=DAOM 197198]POG72353.1 hypothetical protein GLOIN_2v1160608 [Rhizophagus irregularis DAOM 181602=DAOM 197198]GET51732.1 kinase-like domain-containing protein [Rhizophagus irregularis DAOM 181602=DAOM 197198]|eukprot:XP_025179219.1 hypothetical protein GLOIN_2v1160608 [Rhizophagus irregularis DAOM 181602=DAOM 197198]
MYIGSVTFNCDCEDPFNNKYLNIKHFSNIEEIREGGLGKVYRAISLFLILIVLLLRNFLMSDNIINLFGVTKLTSDIFLLVPNIICLLNLGFVISSNVYFSTNFFRIFWLIVRCLLVF